MEILQPSDWTKPRGYANGTMIAVEAGSRLLFIGGQIGWNGQQQFDSDDLGEQVRQTLENIVAVLNEGGARPSDIVRMNWYVKDKQEYVAAYPVIGEHYRTLIGRHFPSMTAVQVADLIEDRAKVEIEVTAVVRGTQQTSE
ncbi:endoribonuclease L-PSP [Advenella kashmirensis W13003]|uniref:Endoribonuclease L-PSP n=1 Tax=Advenella kashmirensis W13003 TaxID=1424334 RepID=V8QVY5_9BURK|nr:RidA family protein [Advenella kashmirensis]ETF03817.1 endoribonuclease L-PSP [Advenella kashmirensis W13003]